jgi:hypothetical protein
LFRIFCNGRANNGLKEFGFWNSIETYRYDKEKSANVVDQGTTLNGVGHIYIADLLSKGIDTKR